MVVIAVGVVVIASSVAVMTNFRGFADKYERATSSWWLGLPADHRWARRQVSLIRWSSLIGVLFGCLLVASGVGR